MPGITIILLFGNRGNGTARDLRLSTSQPRIIDNKKGLLISFWIIRAFLDNQPVTKDLRINVGDVAPHTSSMVEWQLLTQLSGTFERLNMFIHDPGVHNDPTTAVVVEASYHRLVQACRLTNNTPALLTDEDENGVPDTVFIPVNGNQNYSVCTLTAQLTEQSDNCWLSQSVTPANNCPFLLIVLVNPLAGRKAATISVQLDENTWTLKSSQWWQWRHSKLAETTDNVHVFLQSNSSRKALIFTVVFEELGTCPVNETATGWAHGCETCYCSQGQPSCTTTWSALQSCSDNSCPIGLQCALAYPSPCLRLPCTQRMRCISPLDTKPNCALCGVDCASVALSVNASGLYEGVNVDDVCTAIRRALLEERTNSPCLHTHCSYVEAGVNTTTVLMDMATRPSAASNTTASDLAEILVQAVTGQTLHLTQAPAFYQSILPAITKAGILPSWSTRSTPETCGYPPPVQRPEPPLPPPPGVPCANSQCVHGACQPSTGMCVCEPGYYGQLCDKLLPTTSPAITETSPMPTNVTAVTSTSETGTAVSFTPTNNGTNWTTTMSPISTTAKPGIPIIPLIIGAAILLFLILLCGLLSYCFCRCRRDRIGFSFTFKVKTNHQM